MQTNRSDVNCRCSHWAFNNIITEVLDELAPVNEVTLCDCCRQPWLDDETREARKKARRLENRFKDKKDPASKSEWRTALKSSRRLAQSQKASYWKSEIHSAGNNACHVWRTVFNLLGEVKSGAKSTCSPEDCNSYIDKKVADVRAATSSAPSDADDSRRSTLEVTYLDWTASRPWALKML